MGKKGTRGFQPVSPALGAPKPNGLKGQKGESMSPQTKRDSNKKDGPYIDYFLTKKLHLIRIKPGSKGPQDKDWPHKQLTEKQLRNHVLKNGNLGWHVGDNHLVIDVDYKPNVEKPKNGYESLERLLEGCGYTLDDIRENYPCVATPSGGLHIYMSLPSGCDVKTISRLNKKYPHIDFQTGAKQVVIPGSTHPNGGRYTPISETTFFPDFFSDPSIPIKKIPGSVLRRITEKMPEKTKEFFQTTDKLYGCLKGEIGWLLDHIDKPATHDEWVPLLGALNHATAAEPACAADIAQWVDPGFEDLVLKKWETFSPREGKAKATIKTIRDKHLALNTPESIKERLVDVIIEAFETDVQSVFEDVSEYIGRDVQSPLQMIDAIDPSALDKKLVQKIFDLLCDSTLTHSKELRTLVPNLAEKLGKPSQVLHQKIIHKRAGLKQAKKEVLDSLKTERTDKKEEVQGTLVSNYLESKHSGLGLICQVNEQILCYKETHWKMYTKDVVRSEVQKALETLVPHRNHRWNRTKLVDEATKDVCSQVQILDNVVTANEREMSFYNLKNGTLWVHNSGEIEFKPHDPSDYITHTFPFEYDPEAKCPRILDAFRLWMGAYPSHYIDEQIEHLMELTAYICQYKKDIAHLPFFLGSGHNGKSTFIRLIERMVTSDMVTTPSPQDNPFNDNFLTGRMVNKFLLKIEDLDKNQRLPWGILKDFSESGIKDINIKNVKHHTGKLSATILIASNHCVPTKELGNAIRRRILPVRFGVEIPRDKNFKMDFVGDLPDSEFSGLINEMARALARLKRRQFFREDEIQKNEKDKFMRNGNPVLSFVAQHYKPTVHDEMGTPLDELFSHYCGEMETSKARTVSKAWFRSTLTDFGYQIIDHRDFGEIVHRVTRNSTTSAQNQG
jgi:phage/plasmid-associated DNA primase